MKLSILARYTVILSMIPAIYITFFPSKIVLVTIVCSYPLLFILMSRVIAVNKNFLVGRYELYLFMFYSLIMLIRGFIDAKSYQDWTSLFTSLPLFVFIPLTVFFGVYANVLKEFFRAFVFFGILLAFVLLFRQAKGIMNLHTILQCFMFSF